MSSSPLDDLFFYRAKRIMLALGVWVPPDNESTKQKAYKYFMILLQYTFLMCQISYVFQVWGDLDAVSQVVYIIFTQVCLCCKITVFHVNIRIVRELLAHMNSDKFRPHNDTQKLILLKHAKNIKLLLLFFIISAEATCSLWGVKPLLDNERKFPFDMWMPVTTDDTPQYQLGYIFQEATICVSALIYYGVDSVAISMVMFACAQIQIIMDKIMSIKPYENRENEVDNVNEYHRRNYEMLIECVKHHQSIVTFTHSIGAAFHIYFLFQLTGAVGMIAISAFRILVNEQDCMQFVTLVFFLVVMTSQLYLLCWSCNELTATSEELGTAFYSSLWYEQDIKFQRACCFAMMRLGRPIVLRAGNYVALSRPTFLSILRMSYSYIAVLNQTT